MDYVVGSVAALITGNVTPNRPKRLKKPLTPMKHQASPNVTPKSELVDDKSIFLSPTLQKKKAIVKKSPKRIFQNNDLDVTNGEGELSFSSPKADKVKKHLKNELDTDSLPSQVLLSPKSPKSKTKSKIESDNISKEAMDKSKKKKKLSVIVAERVELADENHDKENTENVENSQQLKPKKKRKQSKSVTEMEERDKNESKSEEIMENENNENITHNEMEEPENISKTKSPKKKRKSKASEGTMKTSKSVTDTNELITEDNEQHLANTSQSKSLKKKKKRSKSVTEKEVTENTGITSEHETKEITHDNDSSEKKEQTQDEHAPKNKNRKKKKKSQDNSEDTVAEVNPNAVTNKDSDSEHESDDEMCSENEEENKKTLDTGPVEESSDEDEVQSKKDTAKDKKEKKDQPQSDDEIQRTIFVGNVPFSSKCKKEIKKIFSQYGQIETVRIRTVPVKDARVTPKMAVIKNELHPDRSTVNVYIKFADQTSVNKSLAANNTMLNGCHLRVSRSDSTGAAHDPKCSVFVGNIPFALEDEGLREKFDKCGEIESVRIIRDKKTNAGKGFGYINFKSKDGVELALALTEEDLTIKNRIMRVKRCTQLTHKKLTKQDTRKQGMEKQGYQGQDKRTWNKGNNQFGKVKFTQDSTDGAYRRIKRKNQDSSEGPPNKRLNTAQPKKNRKDFVGMTAEKKKKQKFNKGQKKKKVLSEILTKK